MDINVEVDPRSFQNWRTGSHKAGRKNIHAISRIASGGDPILQKDWAQALLKAPKVSSAQKQVSVKEPATQPQDVTTTRSVERLFTGSNRYVLMAVLASFAVAILFFLNPSDEAPYLTDFVFCDEANFSRSLQKCEQGIVEFPKETSRVFVSFQPHNIDDGQPFTRKWYFRSVLFLTRESFFDDAWPGYTFYGDGDKPFAEGKYDLRVIIDGKVSTASFIIGAYNPEDVFPSE
ncbi:MAG: hypothetical protein AAFP97_08490 [Pseudomonadota bacterium]